MVKKIFNVQYPIQNIFKIFKTTKFWQVLVIPEIWLLPYRLIFVKIFEHLIFRFVLTIVIVRILFEDIVVNRLVTGNSLNAVSINLVINKLTMGKSLSANPAKFFPTIIVNTGCAFSSDECYRARFHLALIPLDAAEYTQGARYRSRR